MASELGPAGSCPQCRRRRGVWRHAAELDTFLRSLGMGSPPHVSFCEPCGARSQFVADVGGFGRAVVGLSESVERVARAYAAVGFDIVAREWHRRWRWSPRGWYRCERADGSWSRRIRGDRSGTVAGLELVDDPPWRDGTAHGRARPVVRPGRIDGLTPAGFIVDETHQWYDDRRRFSWWSVSPFGWADGPDTRRARAAQSVRSWARLGRARLALGFDGFRSVVRGLNRDRARWSVRWRLGSFRVVRAWRSGSFMVRPDASGEPVVGQYVDGIAARLGFIGNARSRWGLNGQPARRFDGVGLFQAVPSGSWPSSGRTMEPSTDRKDGQYAAGRYEFWRRLGLDDESIDDIVGTGHRAVRRYLDERVAATSGDDVAAEPDASAVPPADSGDASPSGSAGGVSPDAGGRMVPPVAGRSDAGAADESARAERAVAERMEPVTLEQWQRDVVAGIDGFVADVTRRRFRGER